MGIACFEAFMRAGRGQALALDMTGRRAIAWKQDAAPSDDPVRQLVDGAWDALFVATTRDVLR